MTILSPAMKRGGLLAPMIPSEGIGPDADEVARRIETIRQHFWQAVTLRSVTEQSWIELAKAATEAALPNWDGCGAKKVDAGAYQQAERFLNALPTTTPLPEVSIDPDGEVSVSWNVDADWVFSVSVGARGRLSYAGLFGTSKVYGTEWFVNEIPEAVLDSIGRVFSATHPSR